MEVILYVTKVKHGKSLLINYRRKKHCGPLNGEENRLAGRFWNVDYPHPTLAARAYMGQKQSRQSVAIAWRTTREARTSPKVAVTGMSVPPVWAPSTRSGLHTHWKRRPG